MQSLSMTMLFLVCLGVSEARAAEKPQPASVTIILRGARTKADAKAFRSALAKVKGIKFRAAKITAGRKPRYFTEPFAVAIANTNKTNVGALALAVSKAQTSAGKDLPPKTNLVLFTDAPITEESVMSLRAALRDVNGLKVDAPGGLGGFPNKGYYWVRLEDAGGASLKDIRLALRKARIKVSFTKP